MELSAMHDRKTEKTARTIEKKETRLIKREKGILRTRKKGSLEFMAWRQEWSWSWFCSRLAKKWKYIELQVSSPILRGVSFKYQDDDILSNSLTSTNFHTFYQGSEMVVAGRLPPAAARESGKANANDLITYKILAKQADGVNYAVHGAYNGSEVIRKKNVTVLYLLCFFVFCSALAQPGSTVARNQNWLTHSFKQF